MITSIKATVREVKKSIHEQSSTRLQLRKLILFGSIDPLGAAITGYRRTHFGPRGRVTQQNVTEQLQAIIELVKYFPNLVELAHPRYPVVPQLEFIFRTRLLDGTKDHSKNNDDLPLNLWPTILANPHRTYKGPKLEGEEEEVEVCMAYIADPTPTRDRVAWTYDPTALCYMLRKKPDLLLLGLDDRDDPTTNAAIETSSKSPAATCQNRRGKRKRR